MKKYLDTQLEIDRPTNINLSRRAREAEHSAIESLIAFRLDVGLTQRQVADAMEAKLTITFS